MKDFHDDNNSFSANWNTVLNSYPHVHGAPVVWGLGSNNANMYVWPEQDFLKVFHFDGQKFSTAPVASSAPYKAAMMSMPGAVMSLSWNGIDPSTGIIWTARPDPEPKQFAASAPFVSAFVDQQHFAFQSEDGIIWDSYYAQSDNQWHFQQVNFTGIPSAAGAPFVSVFADQQHFAYLDPAGTIWDAFYARGNPPLFKVDKWNFQQINTNGHRPVGGIFVSAFHDQQHFVWKDASGRIWDRFYKQADGPCSDKQPDSHWCFQEINTGGHPAASSIFVSVFGSADQQHFAYTDQGGSIWDAFYIRGQNKWNFQQINTAFNCMAPSGADLTPNAAPCNAINKIVRGVLEAFNATPGFNNQLTELWNSKVKLDNGFWFAKQSPPTIADGKVFLAEFPPPIPGGYWSDSRAYGRLVVYSLH